MVQNAKFLIVLVVLAFGTVSQSRCWWTYCTGQNKGCDLFGLITKHSDANYCKTGGTSFYCCTRDSSNRIRRNALGLLTYASVSFIVSSLDLGLAFLLLIAIKPYENVNLEQLLLWFRATFTILIVFILQSLAFFVLLGNVLIIVGLLSSLLYKPLALWFINDYVGIFTGTVKIKCEKPQEIRQVGPSRSSNRRFGQMGDSGQNQNQPNQGQNLDWGSSDEEIVYDSESFIRKQKYIKIH